MDARLSSGVFSGSYFQKELRNFPGPVKKFLLIWRFLILWSVIARWWEIDQSMRSLRAFFLHLFLEKMSACWMTASSRRPSPSPFHRRHCQTVGHDAACQDTLGHAQREVVGFQSGISLHFVLLKDFLISPAFLARCVVSRIPAK